MVEYAVIGVDSSQDLAKKIARRLKAVYVKTESRVFPDGESKIIIKKIPKKSIVLVVQSTFPPVDTNLLHLLSVISKVRKYSSKIYAIIPYIGYARQDREFLEGEIITISVIGKMLRSVGTKKIVTVDIHSTKALQELKIPSENVTAITELVKYFKKLRLKNPLVVSPDIGGKQRAKDFADLLGTDFLSLRKHRDRKTGQINILTSKVAVKNRTVILVDDMISTGGSIIKSTQFLKKQKCKRVFVACTHALLVNDAEKRIKSAGVSQIISTNTVPKSTSKVDVSKIIAESIL
ncbi:MAG: phosphoribosylpyrophosphate synthetase [Candidatus Marinimicrobia bacterium]|jgi:ribose-phosphate pyrophosphokinase|nr:phosphoribosylpyrophosphate synthetase [Candidatus Neomarinimicrobiota bacterium]|tara:strand:- start:463 stop:1338 length:876 start_codon:yes stop_codon:yes gene_type:complete